ncbi:MAG: NAD(P)/FAD-dependent oxidoreductase [Bryobacterales bacterium]|nr:NAD(P)/FAD-dependent oxidoreductase [Bryobacterales bacterium]
MATQAHRVVIIGGGFAGVNAAKALSHSSFSVTLVDRRNYHLFQPLLYQVATGGLSPSDIAYPLRVIFKHQRNVEVLLAEVHDIDVENRVVRLEHGSVPYDSLIIATGAGGQYFGHDGWEADAPSLKTLEEAMEIRKRILLAFETAERETGLHDQLACLTFAVIGAGPTGVELAGTLGEIARDTLRKDFRHIESHRARILLFEGADRVLPTYPANLSRQAHNALLALGVQPRTGVKVVDISSRGLNVEGPRGMEFIPCRTVIWAAGVKASPLGRILAERAGAELDRAGRVLVDECCRVPGHPEIFVAGDLAHSKQGNGAMAPGVAPAAMQMGRYAAGAIRAQLEGSRPKPFHYWNKGSLATIGRNKAVADFGKLHFAGPLAWLIWLFVHLMYLVGFQNRLLVFIQWAISYLTFNRKARLITGGVILPDLAPNSSQAETAVGQEQSHAGATGSSPR